MPYATRSDLETAFGEAEIARLADKNRTAAMTDEEATTAQDAVIAAALERADIKINSLVGNIADALNGDPLLTPILRIQAVDIARWYLMDDVATDQATRRKDDAVQTLKDLRSRVLDVGTSGGGSATLDSGSGIAMQSPAGRWGGGAF